jgi:hypothetical protein
MEPGASPTAPTPGAGLSGAEAVAGAGSESGSGSAASLAPNMLGDLLFATRSIDFRYNRSAGPINIANNGATSVVNSTISDDNSPLPRDRISFRYNHFDNSQSVTGFGPAVFTNGVGTSFAQTKDYNLDRYTFSFEKTFLDRLCSVELRVPFSTTLSPDLALSAGTVTGPANAAGAFPVTATPQNTLGNSSTQFEDISLIFKGLIYRSRQLNVSTGFGATLPTGSDTHVVVTDFTGSSTQGSATVQRVRDFQINNETIALSPFLAALYTPNNRFFAQGFAEVDFPLNSSSIFYNESIPRGTPPPVSTILTPNALQTPFSVNNGITDQPLLHIDLGAGYWVLRDPMREWITGIAPSVELHYTTTLKNASVVTLPGDGLLQLNSAGRLVGEAPPQVGSQRGRVDLLDLTAGTTFLIAERSTLAVGAGVPLRSGDNRTFDWELHVQLNYFFGAPRQRITAPNF